MACSSAEGSHESSVGVALCGFCRHTAPLSMSKKEPDSLSSGSIWELLFFMNRERRSCVKSPLHEPKILKFGSEAINVIAGEISKRRGDVYAFPLRWRQVWTQWQDSGQYGHGCG